MSDDGGWMCICQMMVDGCVCQMTVDGCVCQMMVDRCVYVR